MRYGFINNFSQTLAAELAAGATTLTLSAGGEAFADASSDYRYKLTLIQRDAFGAEIHREIVDVTGRSGNTLTVVRQQEGTTQLSPWPSGIAVTARVTAGHLAGFAPEIIAFGPVDFSDGTSSTTWQAPAGRKLYVDSIDVIPTVNAGGGGGAWELVTGTPVIADEAGGVYAQAVALSPNGAMLAVGIGGGGGGTPHLRIYNTADWTTVAGIPTANAQVKCIDWSPDGTQLAFGTMATPYLFVHNTADWTAVAGTPTLAARAEDMKYKPDGSQLAIALNGGDTIAVYNTADWTANTLPALSSYSYALGWNSDGSRLALSYGASPYLNVYDTTNWSIITGTPTLEPWIYSIAYSPNDAYLAYAHENAGSGLVVYEVDGWVLQITPSVPLAGCLVWSPVGDRLFYGHSVTAGESLQVISAPAWTIESSLLTAGLPRKMDASAAGDTIYAAVDDEPHLNVFSEASLPAPTLNLGADSLTADSLLSGAVLESFVADQRVSLAVNAKHGQATLYAAPGTASGAGAPAVIVVRGYTLEG